MIPRYTLPEMEKVWSESNKYDNWLKVELAVLEVLCDMGMVPTKSLKKQQKIGNSNFEFQIPTLTLNKKTKVSDTMAWGCIWGLPAAYRPTGHGVRSFGFFGFLGHLPCFFVSFGIPTYGFVGFFGHLPCFFCSLAWKCQNCIAKGSCRTLPCSRVRVHEDRRKTRGSHIGAAN